jgi:hypothetical protein
VRAFCASPALFQVSSLLWLSKRNCGRGSAAPWISRWLHFVECSTHGTLFPVSHCTAETIPLGDGGATQLSGTVSSGSFGAAVNSDDSGLRSCIIQEVYGASYHAVLGSALCACTGPGQRSIQFSITGPASLVSCAEVSKDGGAVLQLGRRDLCRRGHSSRAILDPLARSRLAARARGGGDPERQSARCACRVVVRQKGRSQDPLLRPGRRRLISQPQSKALFAQAKARYESGLAAPDLALAGPE